MESLSGSKKHGLDISAPFLISYLHFGFYKNKAFQHIQAENVQMIKHILSISLC